MKYIRTKDGIFEILRIAAGCIGYMNTNKRVDQWTEQRIALKDETPDYKTVDTIEELCDEFVAIREDGIKFLAKIFKAKHGRTLALKTDLFIWRKPLIKSLKKGFQIYGAIWTDKGLIYVAKMNEKGELELL